VVFPHGQDTQHALLAGAKAISYLFIRKDKGWYVHATTIRIEIPVVTERKNGALGLDLNGRSHRSIEIDASGNSNGSRSIARCCLARASIIGEAMLGDAVASAVRYAKDNLIPIVHREPESDKRSGRARRPIVRSR